MTTYKAMSRAEMNRAEIDRAIRIVESSRRTHIEWVDYLASGGTAPDDEGEVLGDVGDEEHHQRCIDGYDHVLAVLRRSLN